jgi:predicted metal-dependent hydrolase
MKKIFLEDEPDLEIFLRQNSNSRRITLRISALDGKITITGPNYLDFKEFKNFAESKKSWLKTKTKSFQRPIFVTEGIKIPIIGTEIKIQSSDVQRPKRFGSILFVSKQKPVSTQVKKYLTEICKIHLDYMCKEFAARLGSKVHKITLRDTRSRWGSCSNDAKLMFSWRLVMAPEDVLAYVAAHEVAHLKHMNHSKDFWETVEYLFGPYKKERAWLKQNGSTLHRYKFES